ncbi:MAG: restriction endonuclease subunit S [Planctomycetaceae bacterium]
MIDGLTPYTDRKDSGLPWLGEIPAHWDVRRNGRLFVQRNQTGFPDLPILEVSLKTGVRVRDFENSNRKQVMADREKYKRARQGDIAYNMMRMWQGAVGTSPVDGLVSPAYVVAKPLPETESRYYKYLFRTGVYMDEVNKFSRGIVSDRNRLYWEDFKQMPSPYPPPEEQAAIVRFLDHADRRIRRYIRAKRQLIALLNEQKQAIIHRAVTRGLDPHVKLKPSGVEWLGDVPEHWEVRRNGFLFQERKEPGDPALPLLVVSLRTGVTVGDEVDERGRPKRLIENRASYRTVRKGDIAYNMMRLWQGAVGTAPVDGLVSPAYVVARSVAQIDTRYFERLFRTPEYMAEVNRRSRGIVSDRNRCYWDDFKQLVSPVPPPDEQDNIVFFLDEHLKKTDAVMDGARCEIDKFKEYRTRLIADVVTGKLDVREAAAALPDELDAVEPDAEELLDEDDTTDEVELDIEPEEVEA